MISTYCAPEYKVLEHSFSPAFDIWTLGCILLEIITWALGCKEARAVCFWSGSLSSLAQSGGLFEVQTCYGITRTYTLFAKTQVIQVCHSTAETSRRALFANLPSSVGSILSNCMKCLAARSIPMIFWSSSAGKCLG